MVGNCKKNIMMLYGVMIDIKFCEVVMLIIISNGIVDIKIYFKVCYYIYY